MKIKNMIVKSFDNLGKRVVYSFSRQHSNVMTADFVRRGNLNPWNHLCRLLMAEFTGFVPGIPKLIGIALMK